MPVKNLLPFLLLILIASSAEGQTRIEKTGSNTWGGAYVPPKWVKTYDQTLKTYNINVESYRSASQSPGGTNSPSSGYTPRKSRWASIGKEVDYEKLEARRQHKSKQAKEISLEYAKELNNAILYYKAGVYRACYNIITRIMPAILTKSIKANDNAEEVYSNTGGYYYVKNYYEYMSGVKAGATYPAVVLYNLNLTADFDFKNSGDGKRPEVTVPYPFTPQLYYFLNSQAGSNAAGFDRYTIEERFMADLFLVELLVDIDKKNEAKNIFRSVLDFYLPRISHTEPFLRQIAINHFYLGNTEEASDLLEYYWNETASYDDRLQVLNELVVGDGFQQKNKWDRKQYPEGYAFVKQNYLFLDSIATTRQLTIPGLSEAVQYHLYVVRGKEADVYLRRISPRMQIPFDSLYANTHGYFNSYNEDVERYLRVLLILGDQDKIRETLQRLAAIARKQQAYFMQQVDDNIERLDEFKHAPQLYWEIWHNRKAEPTERALHLFKLEKFAQEGGKKYLREAARPFLEEAAAYTEKEFTYSASSFEDCGIKPGFLKNRDYPKTAPPSKKELQEQARKQQQEQVTQNRIQTLESKRATAAGVPLTAAEAELNKAGAPFGGLAMFEQAVKNKQPAKGRFYDSATVDFATLCFERAGYTQGKSIRADILMASAAKDKAGMAAYLRSWGAEQLIGAWYPGGIKTAAQVPAGADAMYEQQYIVLARTAGLHEQVYRYIGQTSWTTAIKFAPEHAEALAVSGKLKEAFIFIENFSNYTGNTRDKFVHWDRTVMMKAIVHFHKKDFRESWVHLNDYKININELLAANEKWKANLSVTAYDNPGILIHDDFAYYYFCCAHELKKKNILPYFLPLIHVPPTAPEWMVNKYGKLFLPANQ